MNIICYGDSNTYGYDPRSYLGGRYPADCRWTDILAAETGWKIQNNGMNGREIPRAAIAIPESTELLIVMLGTNDLLLGTDVSAVTHRMKNFLTRLDMRKGKILLVAPPPMKLGEWVPDTQLVNASIQLADHYQTLTDHIGIRFADAGKWNIPLTFDGVHFTENGHKIFAEQLLKQLLHEQHSSYI